jgi:hypothetical protein
MMDQNPELYPLWQEALQAKYYGGCEPFGPREYNKLLGNYDVSSNFPGNLVAEDLIKVSLPATIGISALCIAFLIILDLRSMSSL